jgi:vitamin B12 transporter
MRYVVAVLSMLASPMVVHTQEIPVAPVASPEAEALRSCTELVAAGKPGEAQAPGKLAESLYRQRLARDPRDVEALVGAARAMSQCLVPSADLLGQGELSAAALELLDQAIDLQPDHWLARFVLASISYRSPSFLGRGKRAAREFQELLRIQGDRTDNPMFARVFELAGRQLTRDGLPDSARVLWIRGARLFPADSALKVLGGMSSGATTPVPDPPAQPAEAAASAVTQPATLAVVQVVASSNSPRRLPSVAQVTRSQVLLTPGGAADVLQAVQLQPGATRVGEGGDVYTRGGDPAETSLILNGGRIMSLSRFEGLSGSLFGVIEPFIVKSVRYSSGGFSARHGNALSGVVEIETDGRPRERQTRAGVSLVQASGTFRAPMGRRVGGWVSARATNTALLLRTHGRTEEFSGSPWSQEMIASVIATPTALTEVRATALIERDGSQRHLNAGGFRGPFDSRGDTRALLLSSRWISSSLPLVVRGTFSGSSRSSAWTFGVLSRDRDESSAATRVDAEWEPGSGVLVRVGAEHGLLARLESGTVPTTSSVIPGAPFRVLDDGHARADRIGAYGEAELTRRGLSVIMGLRADRLPGESDASFDPRVAVSLRKGIWTTRLSGGTFHQGRWRAESAIPDAGTPSGLALTAHHVVLGVERESATSLFRAETYVKRYTDYTPFGAGPAIEGTTARGLDVVAQRVSGRVTGWIGYSFLDAQSRVATKEQVPSAFDITHTVTGSITATPGADWSVGTTARYGSGAPRTAVIGGRQTSDGTTAPVYGAIMGERLPSYARLDARVMRYIRAPGYLLSTFVEVLNVTDRRNVSTYAYDPTYTSREAVHTFFSSRTIIVGAEVMFR